MVYTVYCQRLIGREWCGCSDVQGPSDCHKNGNLLYIATVRSQTSCKNYLAGTLLHSKPQSRDRETTRRMANVKSIMDDSTASLPKLSMILGDASDRIPYTTNVIASLRDCTYHIPPKLRKTTHHTTPPPRPSFVLLRDSNHLSIDRHSLYLFSAPFVHFWGG